MPTRFLSNNGLWSDIQNRVAKANRVRAAIAYLGKDGAKLLPLKKGDTIVVDMSIAAVRQGATNPSSIRTLIRGGVKVFSRGSLHAKFLIIDNALIAGSANASRNSKEILDEAGILTTDSTAVRRATDFFDNLCTEPVGKEYLKRCIAEYRPPIFKAALERRRSHAKGRGRIIEAKLWFIGGLVVLHLLEEARVSVDRLVRRAERRRKQPERTEVRWIRYAHQPKFLKHLKLGDWIVDCMKDGRAQLVGPPTQVLGLDEWISPRGARYTMLMLESPTNGESMTLGQFRRKIKKSVPTLDHSNPRTRPIGDNDAADNILRLWTATGRIARAR